MTKRVVALAALIVFMFAPLDLVPEIGSSSTLHAQDTSIGLLAQSSWPPTPAVRSHTIKRGPGGYFSLIKLALIVVVFLVWVKLADWVNKDAIRFGAHTGLPASIWNPVFVFSFLAGFIGVLCIPAFVAGYPVFLLAAGLPYFVYFMQRKGKIPDEARTGKMFADNLGEISVPISIEAAGKDKEDAKSNLIRARQSPVFEPTCQLLHDSMIQRVEQILLDFTREGMTHRIQVDGIWHVKPPMTREDGDALLWVLKTMSGTSPAERRQKQTGVFIGKVGREKCNFVFTSQGVPTGERAVVKLEREQSLLLELGNLGMEPEMVTVLVEKLDSAGMLIFSAPPGHGLTSTWEGALNEADRFTRDFVGVADYADRETERENIEIQRINIQVGESPADMMKPMILKQPHAFVLPNLVDGRTVDLMTDQVNRESRTVFTQVKANSAAEAIIRIMAIGGDRKAYAKSVSAATCQRLVRRLCDSCKEPVQANPKAIQQMGGDPAVNKVLYREYQLPPPERRIDEDGKPIEMKPCANCGGIGFLGRTAIFELILVDVPIRDAILKTPKVDVIAQVARQQGNATLMQNAYRAVLDGRTSMSEVQRVFQAQKPVKK